MNAAQLIEALQDLPPDTRITYWNKCMSYGYEQIDIGYVSVDGELEEA